MYSSRLKVQQISFESRRCIIHLLTIIALLRFFTNIDYEKTNLAQTEI